MVISVTFCTSTSNLYVALSSFLRYVSSSTFPSRRIEPFQVPVCKMQHASKDNGNNEKKQLQVIFQRNNRSLKYLLYLDIFPSFYYLSTLAAILWTDTWSTRGLETVSISPCIRPVKTQILTKQKLTGHFTRFTSR